MDKLTHYNLVSFTKISCRMKTRQRSTSLFCKNPMLTNSCFANMATLLLKNKRGVWYHISHLWYLDIDLITADFHLKTLNYYSCHYNDKKTKTKQTHSIGCFFWPPSQCRAC